MRSLTDSELKLMQGLPALAVGAFALLLAAYGYWLLPGRLPAQYQRHLDIRLTEYQTTEGQYNIGALRRSHELAAELTVIYRRLGTLNHQNQDLLWQHTQFLRRHAAAVRKRLNDPAASLQNEFREQLTLQIDSFEAKANELLEQLAAGQSQWKAIAALSLIKRDVDRRMAHGLHDADKLAGQLHDLLASSPDLSDAELDDARLLLVRLQIESAWHAQAGTLLVCEPNKIQLASQTLQQFAPLVDIEGSVRWQALTRLVQAYDDSSLSIDLDEAHERIPEPSEALTDSISRVNLTAAKMDSGLALAELERACCDGDWSQVGYLLSGRIEAEDVRVVAALGRTVCRLACSPLANRDEAWSQRAEQGLVMVSRAAPYVPEFPELLWELAHWQSDRRAAMPGEAARPRVPKAILNSVITGHNGHLKHTMFALSATLDGRDNVAQSHLQLILRGGGDLQLLSRIVLWQAQRATDWTNADADDGLPKKLFHLLSAIGEVEPDNGLNWLAVGSLKLRMNDPPAARNAFEKAQQLLGELPAIKSMLDAAQKRSHHSAE